jgi:hypothetical protein
MRDTYHSRFIPEGVAEASQMLLQDAKITYQNYLAVRNTADVTSAKPIAVWSQSISGVSAVNPLVVFYDIHGKKREVLIFYFVPDTKRDTIMRDVKQNIEYWPGGVVPNVKFIARNGVRFWFCFNIFVSM